MASRFDTPTSPAFTPLKAPAATFSYGQLKDDEIVKKTEPITLVEEPCVVWKRKHVLQIQVTPKNLSTDVKDKDLTAAIAACRDDDQITVRLIDATETVVSELQMTIADLKVLEGPTIVNELAIRCASRFIGSLCVAHLDSVAEDGGVVKATFVTGDKKYGARTIFMLPKPTLPQATRVEIVNLPPVVAAAYVG